MTTRREHDLLGDRDVPADAYYGVHTLRAIENFPITGTRISIYPDLIAALASIKSAAASSNHELGLLDATRTDAIVAAAEEIRAGKLHDQFVVDMIQGGAGTSTNMNVNEVIANRALEMLGHERGQYAYLHPNDDVNCSQSTNDAYPTALKLGVFLASRDTLAAMAQLQAGAARQGRTVRARRQDGPNAAAGRRADDAGPGIHCLRATMVCQARSHIDDAAQELLDVSLGATAIGTGITSPPGYAALVTERLAEVSGSAGATGIRPGRGDPRLWRVRRVLRGAQARRGRDLEDLQRPATVVVRAAGGLNEINLPPMQPGSSIMPGKVNPVIPEVVNQVCFQLIGYDVTISIAAEASQLELNMAEPIIAHSLSQERQSSARRRALVLAERCVNGITANRDACAQRRRALDRYCHRAQPHHRLRQCHRHRATSRQRQRLRFWRWKKLLTNSSTRSCSPKC